MCTHLAMRRTPPRMQRKSTAPENHHAWRSPHIAQIAATLGTIRANNAYFRTSGMESTTWRVGLKGAVIVSGELRCGGSLEYISKSTDVFSTEIRYTLNCFIVII